MKESLETHIATLEQQLKAAQEFKRLQDLDPMAAAKLIATLGGQNGSTPAPARRAQGGSRKNRGGATAYDKMVKVFKDNGNTPLTAVDIADAAGVKRSTVGNVLYKSHTAHFETVDNPAGQARLWKLKG